ncbi:MAG TPA: diphthine synthase [Archaeoglobaceae archaeon]|nr:diphthine synthase [Archaeoglobaceae archaeon]
MLVFIGIGLWDEKDITLKGYELAKEADEIFIEFYTSKLMGTTAEKIERMLGREIKILERSDLEENSKIIVKKAAEKDIAILVPGDPVIATTHSAITLEARNMGVEVRVVHNASIITAVCGLTGLHNYRFGKSASVSHPHGGKVSRAPIDVIRDNLCINAHTLLFLDLNPEPMTINQAIEILNIADEENILENCYAVGVARAGSENAFVRCDRLNVLKEVDFGEPLHTLVILAEKIHFTEFEYLKEFAGAPEELKNNII